MDFEQKSKAYIKTDTEGRIPRYKWDGSAAVMRKDEEMEADREALNILLGGAE